MLDAGQIRKGITALDKGDDAACRQILQNWKTCTTDEWGKAPADQVRHLVEALRGRLSSNNLQKGNKQPSLHKEVAIVLGNIGPRAAGSIPELIELLAAGVPDPVREAAAVALGKFGRDAKAAVGDLIELCNGRTSLATQAIRALGEIGTADQRVRTALVAQWQTPQTQATQVQAGVALCKLKIDAKDLTGTLAATLMTSQDPSLRKSAAEALGWRGKDDIDAVPALLASSLGDKNEEVQLVAKASLERMKLTQEKAIPVCARQLGVSVYAEVALRKSGVPTVPALIDALKATEPNARVKAARLLATLGEQAAAAVPALKTTLRDRNAEVRLAAAKGLWNVTKQPDLAVPVLVHLLKEKPPFEDESGEAHRMFLQTTIEALWRIGPPASAAVPALQRMTKEKNRLVSESAIEALKKIAPTVGR